MDKLDKMSRIPDVKFCGSRGLFSTRRHAISAQLSEEHALALILREILEPQDSTQTPSMNPMLIAIGQRAE